MKNKILILGVLGQDGTVLSSILNKNEYEIFGVCKNNSDINKINYHKKNFDTKVFSTDITNINEVESLIEKINPNVIVNFAGVSNVFNPWDDLEIIYNQNCQIPLNFLKSIKKINKEIFFFQSSSSLIYGRSTDRHINHLSKHYPLHPYGIMKLFSQNMVNEYRESFGLKCSTGVFFNHESQFRNKNFLSKKVSKFISEILQGKKNKLKLGNLSSKRDISHAEDFMNGVKLVIENKINEDFIFSSGRLTDVYDFVKLFFDEYNLNIEDYVEEEPSLIRNFEPEIYGDNTKLTLNGWKPKYNLRDLTKSMIEFEIKNKNLIY